MRISTLNSAQASMDGIAARQAEQTRLQDQLSTGLRVRSPGDDPLAAAQAEMSRSRLARLAQDQRSTQLATSLLSTAEGALGHGVEILQSVRETLVAAGNGAFNAQDRKTLAQQLRDARDSLLQLANTSDGAGGFVFSGQGSASEPVNGSATPAFGAFAGVQRIGEGGRYAATVDGRASFMALPQGNGVFTTASDAANTGAGWIDAGSVVDATQLTGHNYRITLAGAPGSLTYTVDDLDASTTLASGVALDATGTIDIAGQRVKISGTPAAGDRFQLAPAGQQSVFKTLDDAIAALEGPITNAAYQEQLGRSQANVDRVLDGMVLMRSYVGEEMRRVDEASNLNEQNTLSTTQRRSGLRDLDYAQAISDMQSNQTILEAALKAYANVSRTSLFQFLS